jgi:putative hemolysin
LESEPEPKIILLNFLAETLVATSWPYFVLGGLAILVLLFLSAIFSASENAFFSLTPSDISELENEDNKNSSMAIRLLQYPERAVAGRRLLATILLLNNFINISLVIFTTFYSSRLINAMGFELSYIQEKLVQVVLITFVLVVFGEVVPKVYATQNNKGIVRRMAYPLYWAKRVLKYPFVLFLADSTLLFDRFVQKRNYDVSVSELNKAVDLASDKSNIQEKNILKGIINYGNIDTRQIMKPRVDTKVLSNKADLAVVIDNVIDWGYSRIPVYENNIDHIVGVLYIKDLLTMINRKRGFKWQSLIRAPFFVPEYKKIDDLLDEFKQRRIHMAIVVDEYGGFLGLATMEDVLEEIFGDINDEFDQDGLKYSRINDNTFLFEGKTMLNDMTKVTGVELDYFEEVRGEADTLAGLILELHKSMPKKGVSIKYDNFEFVIEVVDDRRIRSIKVIKK